MHIYSIYSTKGTVEEVMQDIREQYRSLPGEAKARMVVFFSTSNLDPHAVVEGMKKVFDTADVFGCTTAGEIANGALLKNSVVAMIFDGEAVEDIVVGVVEGLREGNNVEHVFGQFKEHYGDPRTLDFRKYFGIVLIDGMSRSEESLMDRIGDLTDVMFAGGSAGDDMRFKETFVFANGRAYTNAAVLALVRSGVPFDVVKSQSFDPSGKRLLATKVDEKDRKVFEFDNKPAVTAYAEAVGAAEEEVKNEFMSHPVGIVIDEKDIYVRSPQQTEGESIKFYCNIKEGADLCVLNSTDIVEGTRNALEKKKAQFGPISALINFHCILRTLELEKTGQIEEYGKVFVGIPNIGFSTYGEEYIGHINQTSTMIVFK